MSASAPSLRVLSRISDVPREAWDALLDARATPFPSWTFLDALEDSGCASPKTSWIPRHLTLWRGTTLIAAAPAYVKNGSDGDFSRDWAWADFAARSGVRYYPKLLITVPFTPVMGRRFLVAPGEDRPACLAALVEAARAVATAERCSSLHVLFPDANEARELAATGLIPRMDFQAHWHDRGFEGYDDWLASLPAKKRHMARRERGAAVEQGITVRTVRGEEIAADRERWGSEVARFYKATIDKLMWGHPWLSARFYARIFADMPGPLEIVGAFRDGHLIAGAFNVHSDDRLFGRYWGCHEEHPFLHFNVCLYHSVDDCLKRGLKTFEGGAGGEHKLHRGFDVSPTYSAHAFFDPRLDRVLRAHLSQELAAREQHVAELAVEETARLDRWRAAKSKPPGKAR